MASEPKDYTSNTEATENKVQFFNLAYSKGISVP